MKGRSDKKFCDDSCRNNYNNGLKAADENMIRNINNALRKNRRILADFLHDGMDKVKLPREKLQTAGFHFKYHTHTYQTQKGHIYFFCYDYGYLPLEGDWYLLVRDKG
ncbi:MULTISPECIES: hypothetical protein [Chitinophagaceae]|uniref:Uncharacterized protein n=1 Tax=Niabella digestorum TaxID=3117701 RepID=A0ABU7RCF0_9BACT